MCLIFLSVNHHPDYKLIVAANRDEFYQRKTAAADFWEEDPRVLAGRDLEAGGTWLGASRHGNISMIPNFVIRETSTRTRRPVASWYPISSGSIFLRSHTSNNFSPLRDFTTGSI